MRNGAKKCEEKIWNRDGVQDRDEVDDGMVIAAWVKRETLEKDMYYNP